VRNANYKFIEFADGTQELYDLRTDLREVNNLIDTANDLQSEIDALRAFGLAVRSGENPGTPAGPVDITGATLVNQSVSCTDYANTFTSNATDILNNDNYVGDLSITVDGDQCVITTNAIPNHDFNDGDRTFPNPVATQSDEYRVPISPQISPAATPLSLDLDNAILLNGVKVDILAAGCFGVGDGRIGCNDPNEDWRYDPVNPASGFRVDSHNAHTQPDGTYHYRAEPNALFSSDGTVESPVVGFAADGFPIFGSFIEDGGNVREVQSSYQLKSGDRPTGAGDPGGVYDGTFRDDYEYIEASGDLDECNGISIDGSYRYYITKTFPYVLACFRGTPDNSFFK